MTNRFKIKDLIKPIRIRTSNVNNDVAYIELMQVLGPDIVCDHDSWNYFANKKTWSLQEASALAYGLTPLIHNHFHAFLDPNSDHIKEPRAIEEKARKAISSSELEATPNDDTYEIKPRYFYIWAKSSGVIKDGCQLDKHGGEL